jgi:hypothetical protein
MSPYLSALETPQSKLRTSLRSPSSQSGDRRRNTAQLLCSQSGHSGTRHNFYVANQERENQTKAPRSPTFQRVSLKGRPASIVEYRLKNCLNLSASSMPPLGFQCVTHRMNIPHEHASYMNSKLYNEQKRQQGNVHRPRTGNPVLRMLMFSDGNCNHANPFRNGRGGAEPIGFMGHTASTNTPTAHLRPYPPHQSYHCIRSVRRADLAKPITTTGRPIYGKKTRTSI